MNFAPSPSGNGFSKETLTRFASSERQRFEENLRGLVEIPSISNDPARADDVRRVAESAADLIRSLGGEASLIPTGGHPIVHGLFRKNPAFPTVTVYNHLDVQPADRADGWRTDPFRFTVEGDRYLGRGTTDDK